MSNLEETLEIPLWNNFGWQGKWGDKWWTPSSSFDFVLRKAMLCNAFELAATKPSEPIDIITSVFEFGRKRIVTIKFYYTVM